MRRLYFGDNLEILRQHIRDESVDLVYLDPPFNSSRAYNIFFQSPPGEKASEAQAMAFKDTWSWSIQSEYEYDEVIHSEHPQLADMLSAMRRFMRESSMMAYLAMMTNRLIELHRILKPTGNLFLHCDTTASAYLRIILDTLFDPSNFRNQIIWKRTSSHNDARRKLGMVADHIFFYGKTEKAQLFPARQDLKPQYVEKFYRHVDEDGRRYRLGDMASPRPRPNLMYEWMGVAQVRDLIGAMQSHQASMAFFLSLTPPTRDMLNEAAIQGFYEAGNGQKYPRVQIFTIPDLIEGTVKPAYFDMSRGGQTFKKAPVEKVRGQQDRLI